MVNTADIHSGARMTLYRRRSVGVRSLLVLLPAIVLAADAAPARAQALFSVEVSPLRVELKLNPGATHTQAVTLKNDSKQPARVRARVDDWYLSKDGTPQFKAADATDPYSAAAWLRLNPPEQLVAAGATAVVRFTTTVPAGTKEGGYRCAVMFEFDPPDADPASRGRDVMFRGRVATLLYATVGNPKPAVELTDLQIRAPRGQAPSIVATLKNSGRVHVRTNGSVVISDASGRIVRQGPLPNVPVLPESERDVSIPTAGEREPPLPPGTYKVEVKLDLGLPALVVGETTLEIKAG